MGQLEVGVRDKSWADQFYVGLTYSQNNKANQLGASINSVNGGQWVESNYLMPTISYKKSDFLDHQCYPILISPHARHVHNHLAFE